MPGFNEKKTTLGYVVKRYPRYSETFIVNEILAHEAVGYDLEIFSLRPSGDTHFQDIISRVSAPVNYLPYTGVDGLEFWKVLEDAGRAIPGFWDKLEAARGEDFRDIYQSVTLARMLYLKGITHIHAHFATSPTTVARLAAHFSGISYSFTAHAKDIFHDEVDPEDLRKKLRDASTVITVTNYNVEYLKERYGPVAEKVIRIYNGLDLKRFPFRNPFERKPIIVAVGRLVEKKGFTDLIDACSILARSIGDLTCRIIGTGPLEIELKEKIQSLGLGNIVEMAGPMPQNEIIGLIQEASVLAAPCVIGTDGNRDGLPTVILEAMALGTPVVSTDVTGIPEVVRNEETGLLVPQHDPKTLAHVIGRLIKAPDLRRNLSFNARKLIEKDFDVHTNSLHVRKTCFYPERKDLRFARETF